MSAIAVYHKPRCVQCTATARSLREAGLAFAEVDLTKDEAMLDLAIRAGHRAAPIVTIDGKIAWSGFRPDLIADLARSEAGA